MGFKRGSLHAKGRGWVAKGGLLGAETEDWGAGREFCGEEGGGREVGRAPGRGPEAWREPPGVADGAKREPGGPAAALGTEPERLSGGRGRDGDSDPEPPGMQRHRLAGELALPDR